MMSKAINDYRMWVTPINRDDGVDDGCDMGYDLWLMTFFLFYGWDRDDEMGHCILHYLTLFSSSQTTE